MQWSDADDLSLYQQIPHIFPHNRLKSRQANNALLFEMLLFKPRNCFLFSRTVQATKLKVARQITVLGIPDWDNSFKHARTRICPWLFLPGVEHIYFQLCQTCRNACGYGAHITTMKSSDIFKKANKPPNNKRGTDHFSERNNGPRVSQDQADSLNQTAALVPIPYSSLTFKPVAHFGPTTFVPYGKPSPEPPSMPSPGFEKCSHLHLTNQPQFHIG